MQPPHWYKITRHYCPLCDSEKIYRERVYGKRPFEWDERNTIHDVYDYCDD